MRYGAMGVVLTCGLTGGVALAQPAGSAVPDQMRREAAGLRAQWQARVAAGLAPAGVVEPSVTSARVLTPEIDVTKAPGLPKIELNVAAGTVGVASFSVSLTSPSGLHMTQTYFQVPTLPAERAHEVFAVQLGNSFGQSQFGLYAERGGWSVTSITLGSRDGQFIGYFQNTVAKLFPNGNALINVSNPNTPDVTPPTLAQGDVLTHSLSVSSPLPYAVVRLPATDALSGVTSETVAFYGPMGANGFPAQINLYSNILSPVSATSGLLYGQVPATQPLGLYKVSYISVCDAAANCVLFDTPGAIETYFSKPELRITK